MRLELGLLTCLTLCTLQPAMAADPPPVTTAPAQSTAAQSSAAQAPAESSRATAASSRDAEKPAADAALDKRLLAAGYKPQMRGSVKYYCRNEAIVGSRFEKKVCATAEELRATGQDAQDALNKVQQSMGNPKGN